MPVLRTKCISTKVTDEEYAQFEALAGGQTLSEWVREVLVKATAASEPPVVLAELLALRAILLNLHFAVCSGEPITAETMRRLIDHADEDKLRHARECLASAEEPRQS
jgi:hypothetical protein